MIIAITSSSTALSAEQAAQLQKFLETFLPRMRKFPGCQAIYHYANPDMGNSSTLVVWESREALERYRQSELIKEAIAFEKKQVLPGTRVAYPVLLAY